MRVLLALLVGCSSAAPTPTTAPAPAPTSKPAHEHEPAPAHEPGPAPAPAALAGNRPCKPGSAEHAAAKTRLEALDKQIQALKPADNHVPANRALLATLESPCFAMIDVAAADLKAEAAPALIELWTHGGYSWLSSYLDLAADRAISPPPSLRKVVSAETRPDHHRLVCSLADPACGRETRGWWLRAESVLESRAHSIYRGRELPTATAEICAAEALARKPARRFQHWEKCVGAIEAVRDAMPLGRIKAPTSGWLIIRGRRGHYSYCDEVRLYSLATGAAYISQSCNQLFVVVDDKVRNGTAADRKPKLSRGAMPVANVRELAWMLMQLGDVRTEYRGGWRSYQLPEGVEPVKPADTIKDSRRRVVLSSSDQTTLAWAVADKSGVLASGTIIWPSNYRNGAVDYALDLLRTAEGGFVDGCPREKPPRLSSLGRARPAVSPLDGDADELALLEGDLVDAIVKGARARCVKKR